MNETPWYDSFFGEDYFEIYESVLPAERTSADIEGIWNLLGLEPASRVLDLACGHGRHAIALAQRGAAVTGFDLSEVFLERAARDAAAAGVEVSWVRGDMRELAFDGAFDAVLNVFTAFGYFEDPEDDVRTLRGVRAALRPGGRFLLELLHRDSLPSRFLPRSYETTSQGTVVLRERTWDLARDVMDEVVTLIRRDGSRRVYTTSVRLYSLDELIAIARRADLEPESWCGGLGGSPLELASRRLALVCRRPD